MFMHEKHVCVGLPPFMKRKRQKYLYKDYVVANTYAPASLSETGRTQ